jgi:divalent metal cation (Fe/Co/Zn/Cd) transporter
MGGVGIGLSSIDALMASLPPHTLPAVIEQILHVGHGHGHSHAAASGAAEPLALWVAAGSIAVKEWLYRASMTFLCNRLTV